ncbi:NUDIX hydrolase [Olleya sp. Bg11-27]|uniref:NUDIX hydrolase n=1 Tax=Olleya sp. Bg11-27 TaxID=2058135 RepID=UPI000C3095FB|nr:NUDIX domain-containing protein [Olleya sp. Bg11-27]AUC76810.1 hydrolase [Olleya sp. Bg11-27]
MNELIDIVDKKGLPTGQTALKSEIHSKGHYHNTVHIWFYTTDGEILLAQRGASKLIYPLLWDVSVAGHINAGETLKKGAIREVKEEIGLKISKKDLDKIGVFECFKTYPNGIIDNEFHHTYITQLDLSFSSLILQEEEVEALKLVSMFDFFELLENSATNGHFIACNSDYYNIVAEAILKKIT